MCSAISKSYPKFHFLRWKTSINVSSDSDPFDFVDFKKSKFREIREVAKPHTENRQVYTHRLIIRNVTLADEAKYTCVVGNSAGWVSKHAFLTVQGKGKNEYKLTISIIITTDIDRPFRIYAAVITAP